MIRLFLTLALLLALPAQATINAASSQHIILVSPDGKRHATHPAGDYDPSPPERVYKYVGTFETNFGGTDSGINAPNAGWVKALTTAGADACSGKSSVLGGMTTGYKPGSGYLLRRETAVTINGSTIAPRSGSGFMYQFLDSTLNYAGCPSGGVNSPRVALSLGQNTFKTILPYDTTILEGFSIFIPEDTQAENCGSSSFDYRRMTFQENLNKNGLASSRNFLLGFGTKVDGDTNPQFFLHINIDESKQYFTSGEGYYIWLGDIGNKADSASDRGKWVDFVIRYRINPYAAAGRGIFQVWRTDPASRSGPLKLVYNLATDTAYPTTGSSPVTHAARRADNSGIDLPSSLYDQLGMAYDLANIGGEIDFRMYKYAWAPGKGCPPYPAVNGSTITTEQYGFGWDDIYIAHESDGADCTDVTPDRASCEAIP